MGSLTEASLTTEKDINHAANTNPDSSVANIGSDVLNEGISDPDEMESLNEKRLFHTVISFQHICLQGKEL